MTQQMPKDEEPTKEEPDNNLDRFVWDLSKDVEWEENVWDVSFQTPEGNLYLVTELDDFIRWLKISELTLTEFMHLNVAQYMPEDLKAAIEEKIGTKIEYLGDQSNEEKIPDEEKLTEDA